MANPKALASMMETVTRSGSGLHLLQCAEVQSKKTQVTYIHCIHSIPLHFTATECILLTPTSLTNGITSCTNRNIFGSLCTFICNEGYYMSSGARTINSNSLDSECGANSKWTTPIPTCRPITCIPPHRSVY